MIKTLAFILVIILFYLLSVLLVQTIKQLDTSDAKEVVKKFIRSCFTTTPAPQVYPIFIGIDSLGYAHSDIIESTFKELKNVFSQCIFDHYVYGANRLFYYFKVGEPLIEMENIELIEYSTKICDNIVHDYLHQNAPTFGYIPNLVTTDYRPGTLVVCISFNQPGLNENYQLKYHQCQRQTKNEPDNKPMTEDWEDEK